MAATATAADPAGSIPTHRLSPAGFAHVASRGRWKLRPHLRILNRRMMALEAREIRKQATFLPPRHGKSVFRSLYFPAWYLGKHPDHRVILASYAADFSAEWGARVRDVLEEWGPSVFGVRVRPDRRKADSWGIAGHDGGMFTCGVGGSLTGRGADLALVDDPVKNAEEALSPTLRAKTWDWYTSTLRTRVEPGGIEALTMTPWHMEDLGGMILETEGDLWDVLRLPALAEPPEPIRPGATGYDRILDRPDPLGRAPGEPLWPARFDLADLEAQRSLSAFWFDAMYQCRPRSRGGGMFRDDWFAGKIIPAAAVPADAIRCRFWDRAGTHGGGDYTAGPRLAMDGDNRVYVEDVVRGQWSEHGRNRVILDAARGDGPDCEVASEQEPGSSGKDQAEAFVRMMAGYRVTCRPSTGSKEVRARPFADQCEAGNVYIVRGDWNADYLAELTAFPTGRNDDQVDGSSGAFNRLAELRGMEATWGPGPFDGRRW